MTALYNEHDHGAAAWLRELIKQQYITEGNVDERSIAELQPADLAGFRRVHFFAGIGGWDYALQLAGWPADRPAWTGSCPCQPFSAAGKRKGQADERHLWPEMFRLIRECRPPTVFGEQVASAIKPGWLDGVFGDLEAEGYTCRAIVLGAHSVGAPHIRQRLYWVAYNKGQGRSGIQPECEDRIGERSRTGSSSEHDRLADTETPRGQQDSRAIPGVQEQTQRQQYQQSSSCCENGGLAHAPTSRLAGAGQGQATDGNRQNTDPQWEFSLCESSSSGNGLENTQSNGRREWRPESIGGSVAIGCGDERVGDTTGCRQQGENWASIQEQGLGKGCFNGWSDYQLIHFRDGKTRRIKSGLEPLVDGLPGRVGLLRGYGNAIVPQTAAVFIKAVMETLQISSRH